MTDKPKRAPWIAPTILTTVILLTILVIVAALFPRCVYSEYEELDLSTGRLRTSRDILFVRVYREISETPLSEALAGEPPVGEEQWVRTGSNWGVVVTAHGHTRYGLAYGQMCSLEMVWERMEYDCEARAKTATQFLRIVREGGRSRASEDYVRYLMFEAAERTPPRPTTAADISDDLVEIALAGELMDRLFAEQDAQPVEEKLSPKEDGPRPWDSTFDNQNTSD